MIKKQMSLSKNKYWGLLQAQTLVEWDTEGPRFSRGWWQKCGRLGGLRRRGLEVTNTREVQEKQREEQKYM